MKYLIATLCLLLCLSGDPVQMLQQPFSLLQTGIPPTQTKVLR